MIFLKSFTFPGEAMESGFFSYTHVAFNESAYPFKMFLEMGWDEIKFSNVTIFYGGNGSGKSTALNIIADSIGANRGTLYNGSRFFDDYVGMCSTQYSSKRCRNKEIITSDGVFDCMLDVRQINGDIDYRREELFDEYSRLRKEHFQLESIEQLEHLRKVNASRRMIKTGYARRNLGRSNISMRSNGENALQYFARKIDRDGIYLLDEPENSLSPDNQLELLRFLEDSVRFYNCQLIMATHSPFLLSMRDALVYDLDDRPVRSKKWTELKNMQIYRDFFKLHEQEF